MYVPAEKIAENVLTTYFFTTSAWLYNLKLQGNWKKETSNVYKNIKCQKNRFFPCLVSYIYLIVSFLHVYTECNSLYFLSKLQILTLRSLICQNLQRQKLNDRKLTGLKHTRHVSWLVETYSDQRKIMDCTRIPIGDDLVVSFI